jgi:hypothetical protein
VPRGSRKTTGIYDALEPRHAEQPVHDVTPKRHFGKTEAQCRLSRSIGITNCRVERVPMARVEHEGGHTWVSVELLCTVFSLIADRKLAWLPSHAKRARLLLDCAAHYGASLHAFSRMELKMRLNMLAAIMSFAFLAAIVFGMV